MGGKEQPLLPYMNEVESPGILGEGCLSICICSLSQSFKLPVNVNAGLRPSNLVAATSGVDRRMGRTEISSGIHRFRKAVAACTACLLGSKAKVARHYS